MQELVGGCLCGQVRYRLTAPAAFTAACHCTHCQKSSGSAFAVVLGVPREAVTFEGGPMSTYRDAHSESGLPLDRSFCPTCGSGIVSDVGAAPSLLFIKAGTLDDTSQVQPQLDIWCEHAQPWVKLGEGTAHIPRNPPM